MNIAIDWGNSAIKAGFFENGALIEVHAHLSIEALHDRVRKQPPDAVVISSTSRPAEQLRDQLPLKPETYWLTVDGYTPLPMEKRYDTPHTLGTDRIAAAVGATVRFPVEDCLVIDMGTCVTYDYVDADSVFHGGMISPGFRMRFRAMHSFTERLPLVEPEEPRPTLLGKNTRQAMQSGVINGLLAELNGIIDAHRRERPNIKVLICGGDAPFFESSLKPPIFVVPELVLIGLNRILQHNVYLS
ncbi:type III pantothenate kinase [Larkinella arboricola]|uniref:Type III pantothenate kinase n=1 Tax=Larkinella arboricola TaxID=643671 RepID=A0A327X0C4_LARAB|nr:type III pantothenate kinase [Larkinella arboricola]RAJ99805.1 type III pantothenate kinase [Larkinella arboricola]